MTDRPSRMGRFFLELQRRKLLALVSGGFDWVDVRDVVRGLAAAAERGRTGENYILSGHWCSVRELSDLAAQITSVPAPRWTAPSALAGLAAPAALRLARRAGREPLFTTESLHALGADHPVVREKATRELGYEVTGLRDTVTATIAGLLPPGERRASSVTEATWHSTLTLVLLGLAAVTFVALIWVSAPYGRHDRVGWGPRIGSRYGWVVMEIPACSLFLAVFLWGRHASASAPLVLLAIWQGHYAYRTFVYPWQVRDSGRGMPVLVAGLGFVFQCTNSYLNARWISELGTYDVQWLRDPRLLGGAALFCVGFWIHLRADAVLQSLRGPAEHGYQIPRGGLYRWVSCPNYLGEIVEWFGWAVATWSLPGLAFAMYTAANLVPRARSHHRWYREHFPDYPTERRALVPGLW